MKPRVPLIHSHSPASLPPPSSAVSFFFSCSTVGTSYTGSPCRMRLLSTTLHVPSSLLQLLTSARSHHSAAAVRLHVHYYMPGDSCCLPNCAHQPYLIHTPSPLLPLPLQSVWIAVVARECRPNEYCWI